MVSQMPGDLQRFRSHGRKKWAMVVVNSRGPEIGGSPCRVSCQHAPQGIEMEWNQRHRHDRKYSITVYYYTVQYRIVRYRALTRSCVMDADLASRAGPPPAHAQVQTAVATGTTRDLIQITSATSCHQMTTPLPLEQLHLDCHLLASSPVVSRHPRVPRK